MLCDSCQSDNRGRMLHLDLTMSRSQKEILVVSAPTAALDRVATSKCHGQSDLAIPVVLAWVKAVDYSVSSPITINSGQSQAIIQCDDLWRYHC